MPSVLITGANRGIGLAHVRRFADRGWRVFACCRQPSEATELKAIVSGNARVSAHRMDVADFGQVAQLAYDLKTSPIDMLINNAGSYGPKGIPEGMAYQSFGRIDYEIWANILRVNVMGAMKVTESFVDHVARSDRKIIIMMSSEIGSIATNKTAGQSYAYRSSKAALNMISKGLALDLASRGIIVIALAPGWVKTDMGGKSIATYSPDDSVAAQQQLFDRLTTADSGKFINLHGTELEW